MRVLVTGGAGFIGQHLCTALRSGGAHVTVVDIKEAGNVLNPEAMRIRVAQVDAVFHLAAIVGFKHVMADPWKTAETELEGMRALLWALRHNPKPTVFTSSSAVYGRFMPVGPWTTGGVQEGDDCVMGPTTTPSWTYAWAKGAAECLAIAAARQHHLPIRIARLFNVVGPGQSADAGFVIPRFVRQAMSGAPITVYAPGTQTRTFGHVSDIVQGLRALAECEDAIGHVVNLGGTETISMIDLAQLVKRLTNSRSEIEIVEAPYGPGYDNVTDRRPDLSLAKQLIGYTPHWTLENVIHDTMHEIAEAA